MEIKIEGLKIKKIAYLIGYDCESTNENIIEYYKVNINSFDQLLNTMKHDSALSSSGEKILINNLW